MIRLICSSDRQGLEALENKLSRSGILSEIRGNPLTAVLGIPRFELFVHEGDLPVASRLCQGEEAVEVETNTPTELRSARGGNGFKGKGQSELLIEAKVLSSSATAPLRDDDIEGKAESDGDKSQNDLAQATALLEEEVEALLARENKLIDRCAALEEKVKTGEQVLAQTRAELFRETSNRSETERKLAEVAETRASLVKEMQALELRLKTSEQSLAAARNQLELQAQQQEQLARERREQQEQVQAYVGTVNELRSRVRARLAAKDSSTPASAERRLHRSTVEN